MRSSGRWWEDKLEIEYKIGHIGQIQKPIDILHVGNVDKNSDREYLLQVQEADIDGDQHVSFEEFRDIFNEGWIRLPQIIVKDEFWQHTPSNNTNTLMLAHLLS